MYFEIEEWCNYYYHFHSRMIFTNMDQRYSHKFYLFLTESEVIEFVRNELYDIYSCDPSMDVRISGPGENSNTIYVTVWFKEDICFDIYEIAITPIEERDY